MSWNEATAELKRQMVKRPPKAQTLNEIADEMGKSRDKVSRIVKRLVSAGAAIAIPGEAISVSGAVIPCTYYRLLPKPKRGRK